MELFGNGYVIDHCISVLRREREESAYKMYVTESLRAIVNNTARFAGGSTVEMHYSEIIAPQIKKEEEEVSAAEVVDNIRNKIRSMRAKK